MFVCPYCGKRFESERGLKIHIGLKHNPDWQERVCPYCGTPFPSKKALEEHMKQCPHRPPKALKKEVKPPVRQFRGGAGKVGVRVVKKEKIYDVTTEPSGKVLVEGKHVRFVRYDAGMLIEPVKASRVLKTGRKLVISTKTGQPRKEWVRETTLVPRFKPVLISYAQIPKAEQIILQSRMPKYAKDEALELLPKAITVLTMV